MNADTCCTFRSARRSSRTAVLRGPGAAVCVLVLFGLFGAVASGQTRLDRVVARVGSESIFETDVKAAIGLGIVDPSGSLDPEAATLEQLIDRQLMLMEILRGVPPEPDPEAVEAVSEILARAAPAGVSVESPFTTALEGLVAEVDPSRPAIVRAYLPAGDRAAADRAVREVEERLGHLQAFGLRPIGDVAVSVVHEEDWASAWKEHFPVLRVGRRTVIRPTWRDHAPVPGEQDRQVRRIDL